ncbi:MAG: PAS domain S-box protein [Rubrivivax sp.]
MNVVPAGTGPHRHMLRSRVARRLVVWTLLAGGIGTLLVSLWQADRDYHAGIERDAEMLDRVAALAAPTLAKSLWAFDYAQLRLNLESFARLPDVSAVMLQADGQGDWQMGVSVVSGDRVTRSVDLVHDDEGRARHLGRLTLVKDLDDSRAQYLSRWTRAAMGNAVVILLSALGSVLIYHLIVARRLMALAQRLRAVTPEDLLQTPPAAPVPPRRPDELDLLLASVATLQATGHQAMRRNAEQHAQLRESELLYHSIVRGAGDGILLVDAGTLQVIESNDAASRLLGCTREQMLALTLADLDADHDTDGLRAVAARVGPDGDHGLRTRLRRRDDGRLIDVQVSLSRVTLDGRECMLGICRDVSQEKAAREAIESAAEWHRTLIHNTVEGVAIFDQDRHVIECNARFCEMLGYSADELRSMYPWDFDILHSREMVLQAVPADGDTSVTFETRHRRKDGSEYDAEVSVQSALVHGRRVYVSLTRDVTQRRRAERELRRLNLELEDRVQQRTAELRAANARLATTQFAMDAAGIGIHWVDPDNGRILWANRASAELLGYTVEELQALSVPDIDPGFPPQAFGAISRRLQQEGRLRFESTQRRRDGALVPVELTIHHHPGGDDTAPVFVSFISDIRLRKSQERALQQAKDAAETANRAKSAFLANMSHEIRTPLNAITGMAHLIRRGGLAPRQAERMDKLEAAGEHLLSVIDAILELSKIEAGKFTLAAQPLRVESLLGNVSSMLHDRAAAKGLLLTIESGGLPPHLVGDATRLQQALLNYASNAIKFTDRGRVTLRARLADERDDAVQLRFEVQDTGVGIDPEVLPRLFHAFEQADNSTTRKHGGTGLGLAITRKIAQLMDGDAGADSVPGAGSTFWFTAWLQKSAVGSADPSPIAIDAEAQLRRNWSGRRVLLAEDEPVNREVALELLADAGLVVEAACDGLQVVQMAASGDHDLILMDMQMPGQDGLAATREIRRLPGWARRPIIAMTANAFEDDRRACQEAGMDDFIAKPVEASLLYAMVASWLARSVTAETVAEPGATEPA